MTRNIILKTGLFISIISLIFNTYVLTKSESKKNQSIDRIDYYRIKNISLYNDLIAAEQQKFFADFYNIWLINFFKSKTENDSINTHILLQRRDASFVKSINYAFNSTVLDPTDNWDEKSMNNVTQYVNLYNQSIKSPAYNGFDSLTLKQISADFSKYEVAHDSLIRNNNKEILNFKKENNRLDKRLAWYKSLGMIFQVIGLILIFLKDSFKEKTTTNK
ncbi:MAG: hypothetical protein V2B15_00400 [Bacteroidota bacterium]